MKKRTVETARETSETKISLEIRLDGPSGTEIETGLPFLNHMLDAFATHGRFGFRISASGDIQVDPHHLIEDCGIVLGSAILKALGDFKGINRAGFFIFPMDGSLATVALDICGRPNLVWNVPLEGEIIGGVELKLFRDFFKAVSDGMRATVHVNVPYRDNDHHALEAAFKAFGRALREAVTEINGEGAVSTKGKIDA
ncbi:MAG: imidazoleglycerol-phosphate dehydratase HisB [Planctomycetota bacterium]|jgi:imidazoleglycerol-phosphate dehydratase